MCIWAIFAISLIALNQNCLAQQWIGGAFSDKLNMSDFIDENLSNVKGFMQRLGYDPLKLPNITDVVYANILWRNTSITVNLTDGVMHGASDLKRTGDFIVKLLPKNTFRISGKVFIKKLEGTFNYSLSLLSERGNMNVTIVNTTADLSFDFKLNTFRVGNVQMNVQLTKGGMKISMDSNLGFSWFKNIIADIIIPYFETTILSTSAKTMKEVARKSLAEINKHTFEWISKGFLKGLTELANGNYKTSHNNG